MMRPILKGSTDQSVVIRIVDETDGTPETGVVFNTSGIDLWYRREGATKTSITEATLSALNDAHSDGGILHIGDGYYRLDLPDAAVATGANGVMVGGTVTGMVVIGCYVPLYDVNPYDAVRMGMTALPNAAAEAAGGLYTRGSGAGQIAQDANGRINANVAAISGDSTAADNEEAFFDGTGYAGTNNVIPTVTNVTNLHASAATAANQTTILNRIGTPTDLGGGTATLAGNLADIEAQTDDIGAAGAGLTAIPNSAGVTTLLSRVGTPSDLGSGASVAANLADIEAQTDDIGAAGAGLTAITGVLGTPAGASLAADVAAVKSDTAAILDDTGTSGVVVAAASKTGYRLSATGVDDVLDEVVLGSYTLRHLLRGLAAASFGKLSGAATTTVTIRSADDTKDVVIATVDADGNRSAITLDLT
jgi:hypothetical protein